MLRVIPMRHYLPWILLLCSLCLHFNVIIHRKAGGVDTSEQCAREGAKSSCAPVHPTGDIQQYDPYSNLTHPPKGKGFLVPPRTRKDLGRMLEYMGGFHIGVELGVQRGEFAKTMLETWPSCKKYYLVDLWAQQENYVDIANVDNAMHAQIMNNAMAALAQWKDKTVFVKNYTSVAADLITDELDFVYVDARHDYCGCKEDIYLYWPKIRSGGVMAGHDYVASYSVMLRSGQNWSLCMDGTMNDGAVQGAVDEFAAKHGLTVAVTYADKEVWRTWIIRKP